MSGIHCLDQIRRLFTTAFAENDPVGPHSQRVSNEATERYLASSIRTGRASFQTYGVRVRSLYFASLFYDRDSLRWEQPVGEAWASGADEGRISLGLLEEWLRPAGPLRMEAPPD